MKRPKPSSSADFSAQTAKSTFLNLPEAKRRCIVEEAIREFAANGYRQASLNVIAKRLGIAKGSLYQYFENKESLFLYLFTRFTAQVKSMLAEAEANEGGDFFAHVEQALRAGIRFIDRYPEYYEIYLKLLFEQAVPWREELIAKVRLFSLEFFGPLCEDARRRGVIRGDLPIPVIVFVLDATLDRFLQGYARGYLDGGLALAGRSPHELSQAVQMVIAVLRDGLSPRT